ESCQHRRESGNVATAEAQCARELERREPHERPSEEQEQFLEHHEAQQEQGSKRQADGDGREKVAARLRLYALIGRLELRPLRLELCLDVFGARLGERLELVALRMGSAGSRRGRVAVRLLRHSDLEQLGFLLLERVVDGVDVGLRDCLELFLAASDLVFTDLRLESVEVVLRLSTDV